MQLQLLNWLLLLTLCADDDDDHQMIQIVGSR
jgi:hypothetical protein